MPTELFPAGKVTRMRGSVPERSTTWDATSPSRTKLLRLRPSRTSKASRALSLAATSTETEIDAAAATRANQDNRSINFPLIRLLPALGQDGYSTAPEGPSMKFSPGNEFASVRPLLELLQTDLPIIQAPMAGTSSPALAAAVSEAGALGSLGVGAVDAAGARKMIADFRSRSSRSLHVNVFCHHPPRGDAAREAAWIERLRPEFVRLGTEPPRQLTEIYQSFVADKHMLDLFLEAKPK